MATMIHHTTESQGAKGCNRMMSKKKFYEIEQNISTSLSKEQVNLVLETIKQVLNFDPEITSYDKDQAERIRKYRERKKNEGISTYVSSGAKAFYEKTKTT